MCFAFSVRGCYHNVMENEKTKNIAAVSKEQLLGQIDGTIRTIRRKAITTRTLLFSLTVVCVLFLIGIGNKSIIKYILVSAALASTYYLGRTDLTESFMLDDIEGFKEDVKNSGNSLFPVDEEGCILLGDEDDNSN